MEFGFELDCFTMIDTDAFLQESLPSDFPKHEASISPYDFIVCDDLPEEENLFSFAQNENSNPSLCIEGSGSTETSLPPPVNSLSRRKLQKMKCNKNMVSATVQCFVDDIKRKHEKSKAPLKKAKDLLKGSQCPFSSREEEAWAIISLETHLRKAKGPKKSILTTYWFDNSITI